MYGVILTQHVSVIQSNQGLNSLNLNVRIDACLNIGGHLGCNVEVLMLLQQLLCVVNAGAGRGVCGQVELACVVNPLQRLKTHTYTHTHTAHP